MSDLSDDDLQDLREELRERKRERLGGHTLARIHDGLMALTLRVDGHDAELKTIKGLTPSGRPAPMHRRLDSIAEIKPSDSPDLAMFKQEDLAPVVAAFRMTRTLWRVAVAVFALAATVVTTYAAVKGLK